MKKAVLFFLISGMVFLLGSVVFAYDMAEYYPTGQGSFWTWNEKGSDSNSNSWDTEWTESIDGFETVNYGSNGFTGYKISSPPPQSWSSIENFDNDGLWVIKDSGESEGAYSLFGGSEPTNPYLRMPKNMELGESHLASYTRLNYDSADALLSSNNESSGVTLIGTIDVTRSAGYFPGSLRVGWEVKDDAATFNESGELYLAKGVGPVYETAAIREGAYSADITREVVRGQILHTDNGVSEQIGSYFPLNDGSRWEYSGSNSDETNPVYKITGTEEVDGILTKKFQESETNTGLYLNFCNDDEGLRLLGTDGDQYFTVPFKLAGATFNTGDIFLNSATVGSNSFFSLKTEILGHENLNLLGYTGDALKIKAEFFESGGSNPLSTETWWLAQGVGLVQSENTGDMEDGWIFGNVKLTGYTVTPEPISSALFLLGAGALAGARRLRRKI